MSYRFPIRGPRKSCAIARRTVTFAWCPSYCTVLASDDTAPNPRELCCLFRRIAFSWFYFLFFISPPPLHDSVGTRHVEAPRDAIDALREQISSGRLGARTVDWERTHVMLRSTADTGQGYRLIKLVRPQPPARDRKVFRLFSKKSTYLHIRSELYSYIIIIIIITGGRTASFGSVIAPTYY